MKFIKLTLLLFQQFCDLLLARFGLITQLKEMDEGISEAISSIIWIAPRLADIAELKIVSDILQAKYGKPFGDACRASVHPANVSEKLQHKMSIQAPPKLLVEKYLIEISKIYNIDYEPDQSIMQNDGEAQRPDGFLIDLNEKNNLNTGGGGGFPGLPPAPGFVAYPQPPSFPIMPPMPPQPFKFDYTTGPGNFNNIAPSTSSSAQPPSAPFNYNIKPSNNEAKSAFSTQENKDTNVNFIHVRES